MTRRARCSMEWHITTRVFRICLVAVVLFLISLAVALVYQRYVLRRDTEGAITEGKK